MEQEEYYSLLHSDGPSDPSDAIITVQLPETEIYDLPPEYQADDDPTIEREGRRPSWFKRRVSRSKSTQGRTIGVRMRKGEFFSYFVKDEKTGQYREGVVEPPGGRQMWLQQRLQDQQTWPPARYGSGARGKLDSETLAPTGDGPAQGGRRLSENVKGFMRTAIDAYSQQQGVYLRPHNHHEL